LSVERVAEMDEFWAFMKKTRRSLSRAAWKSPDMAVAILDTSIYIDHWERGLYQDTFESLRRGYTSRHSAVVLSELRRGARGSEPERLVLCPI
jgi:hypothetical protein